jgi:probable phosphoglycerate mutase
MPTRQVYLVRHGETEWTVSGQHTSISDIPLTAKGREEAARLASRISRLPFSLVLTSPLQRARQTCDLAGLGGRHVEVDNDLLEWHYGEYEGLTSSEIEAIAPGWMLFTDGCPGGESPEQIGTRVDRVIARVRSVDGDVALFAHGHFFRVLAARWLGLPVGSGSHFVLDTACVCVLSDYRGVPAVERWNDLIDHAD